VLGRFDSGGKLLTGTKPKHGLERRCNVFCVNCFW
jgi:hypothetical protein